jgi:hypothetical protein
VAVAVRRVVEKRIVVFEVIQVHALSRSSKTKRETIGYLEYKQVANA